jgi:hypothetical protein
MSGAESSIRRVGGSTEGLQAWHRLRIKVSVYLPLRGVERI